MSAEQLDQYGVKLDLFTASLDDVENLLFQFVNLDTCEFFEEFRW